MKDLQVFEDNETKTSTDLPNYNDAPTFQGFFLADEDEACNPENQATHMQKAAIVTTPLFRAGRKVKPISKIKEVEKISAHRISQKIKDAERVEQFHISHASWEIEDANESTSSCAGQDVEDTNEAKSMSCAVQEVEDADDSNTFRAGRQVEDTDDFNIFCAGQKDKNAIKNQ